jgi:pyruvate dehydrogenase E2 component (dihydrolipoamide acetyltransferase)
MANTVTMPKLGFDMAEGTLVRWVIQEGETVAKGAVLAEIETDKATVEVESTYDGVMARHLVQTGDIVPVNTPIAIIAEPGEKVVGEVPTVPQTARAEKADEVEAQLRSPGAVTALVVDGGALPGGVKASPLARRIAQDAGIDLRALRGTGPDGRIIKKDVQSYLSTAPAPVIAGAPAPVMAPSAVVPAPTDQVVPLNRLRAAIGRRMVEAKQQAPHFYVTHEYDMAAVMALRQQINDIFPESEKLSVNDFILKAAALTLRQFPNLNASLQGNQVVRHGQVNIGVAVAVEGGLLTVVCRNTDQKPLRQIAAEVRAMVGRAREGKVRPDDIAGSTFSVSNLGMYDVEHFIAIINPPEAAILAIGSAREVPVVKDGMIQPGLRMKATLSVDHRVSDGVEAARYLQALANYLEMPLRLVIEW